MPNNPLGYDERRYEVPVFDFGWGEHIVVPQIVDDDADPKTYIRVKFEDYSQGDPEISAFYVQGEDRDIYRFRVTDLDDLECSYKGENPNDLPVEIQHAVYSFGYSIRNLESITQWMFRLTEATEIVDELGRLNDEYEDLPLVQFLLRDTLDAYRPLAGFLAARSVLGDREYESLWSEVMLAGSGQNGDGLLQEFQANALDQISNIDAPGIDVDGEAISISEGIELTEKDTQNGHALFVDYVTPFGVARCRFLESGDSKYACQHPEEGHLPPEMIRMLKERGITVTNRESIDDQETALQIVEHASLFADQLRDYPLCPDTTLLTDGQPYVPINIAAGTFERANSAAMALVPFKIDEDVTRKLHDAACEKVGIESVDQLSQSSNEKMLTTILEALPEEMAVEWRDYMESNEAYNRPEEGEY